MTPEIQIVGMAMFLKLPHEICREIGSYLDYESRMNFNRNVDLDDRYVKRLNSDKHNRKVKIQLLLSKLKRHAYVRDSRDSARSAISIFRYLINTKDRVLFIEKKMIDAIVERATHYSKRENAVDTSGVRLQPRLARCLVRVSKKLLSKVKNGFT